MRKIILFFLVGIAIYSAGTLWISKKVDVKHLIEYSACSPSIRYKIGTIDKRFNLSEKQVLKDIQQAEDVWEDSYGKDVFVYDPEGTLSATERVLTINMVYDTRQGLNNQVSQLEKNLGSGKKQLNTSISDYEAKVADFNRRSEELSQKIKGLDINDPQYRQKFDEVYNENKALQDEANQLNQLAASLNQSTQSYNSQVNKLNSTINKFNSILKEKPEEGIYKSDGDLIEIYLNITNKELIHTIAHELGHSLGLEHINNEKAIMFPFTTEILKAANDDKNAIIEACKTRSIFE